MACCRVCDPLECPGAERKSVLQVTVFVEWQKVQRDVGRERLETRRRLVKNSLELKRANDLRSLQGATGNKEKKTKKEHAMTDVDFIVE